MTLYHFLQTVTLADLLRYVLIGAPFILAPVVLSLGWAFVEHKWVSSEDRTDDELIEFPGLIRAQVSRLDGTR